MRPNFLVGIQCCGSTIGFLSFNRGFVQVRVQNGYNGVAKLEAVKIGSGVSNRTVTHSEVLV